MISLIVCGTLFVLGSILVFICCDKGEDEIAMLCGVISIVSWFVGVISIAFGYSAIDEAEFVREKQKIEIGLQTDAYMLFIDDAHRHNRRLNVGNNYWFRFTIEDREYLKIDVDKYVKLERV